MQNVNRKNGFGRVQADVVGDLLRKGSGSDWYRAGLPPDMNAVYAVIMDSMRAGSVLWKDSKISSIDADLVINAGIPEDVGSGWAPYSSIMMIDESGLILTFTSSSWGGRNALAALIPQYTMQGQKSFPLVKLSSKAHNNSYGTIDPIFQIVGWTPRAKFEAILGPSSAEVPAIAAPEQKPDPVATRRRPTTKIIEPFMFTKAAAAFWGVSRSRQKLAGLDELARRGILTYSQKIDKNPKIRFERHLLG